MSDKKTKISKPKATKVAEEVVAQNEFVVEEIDDTQVENIVELDDTVVAPVVEEAPVAVEAPVVEEAPEVVPVVVEAPVVEDAPKADEPTDEELDKQPLTGAKKRTFDNWVWNNRFLPREVIAAERRRIQRS